jgi:hypothetical protein
VLSKRESSVDSGIRGCLIHQAGKHVECGIEADNLVVGARATRVSEQLAVGGDEANIRLAVAAIDRQDSGGHAAHRR